MSVLQELVSKYLNTVLSIGRFSAYNSTKLIGKLKNLDLEIEWILANIVIVPE